MQRDDRRHLAGGRRRAAGGCGGVRRHDGTTAAAPTRQRGLPQGSEPVELDPAEFTTEIDNPLLADAPRQPLGLPRDRHRGRASRRWSSTVTDRTKQIANGVEARVVRDVVTEDGVPVEVTDDWYAQDSEGNVWYLGEDTAEYENGKVSSTRGLVRGRRRRRRGRESPCRRIPEPGHGLPAGVLRGRGRGRGAEIRRREEQAEVPVGHFTRRADDQRPRPDRAEGPGAQVLRPGVGPVLDARHLRRRRARGAAELPARDKRRRATGARGRPAPRGP